MWLEPEDSSLSIIYPGGLSGAFPPAVQQQLLQSVPGLEGAIPVRFAYDVEYLVIKGTEVSPSLEAKRVEGLFLAGQVLGTTGQSFAAIPAETVAVITALHLLLQWNTNDRSVAVTFTYSPRSCPSVVFIPTPPSTCS